MNRAPHLLVSGVVLGQPMGGVRRHNRELLPRLGRTLEAHGGSLTVLEGRDRIEFELPDSIAIVRSNVPMHPVVLRAEAESRALRKALHARTRGGAAFDLVHTAHLPAPRGLDVPFTLTIHDLRAVSEAHTSPARRLVAQRVLKDAVKRALRVFTVSAGVASELTRRFEVEPARMSLVHNGVDHFAPLPRGAATGAPIRCLGHVEPRKNLAVVIRALAQDRALPDVEIHGAAKGDEEARLRALCDELGVTARVRFAGPFEEHELPHLYATAACVCVPSWIEGFGIVALEAQRALVPLAVARGTNLVEVAGHETPAFAPDDAADCARAIRAALALDAAHLARAEQRANTFTWDAAAKAWFEGLMEAR